MDTDRFSTQFEEAKDLASDTLSLIQERNLKHPGGGPEASRITAAARRKLGTLGTLIDNIRTSVESPECATISENEKNRRRDLLNGLRIKREEMLHALKRDQPRSARAVVLSETTGGARNAGKETDSTAELDSRGLIVMQQHIMRQQDTELEHLERSVVTTKHVALQINEETDLHNRLLDELDTEVDTTTSRMAVAQRKLKLVMRRASGCKTQLCVALLGIVLVLVVILGFKIAIHL